MEADEGLWMMIRHVSCILNLEWSTIYQGSGCGGSTQGSNTKDKVFLHEHVSALSVGGSKF